MLLRAGRRPKPGRSIHAALVVIWALSTASPDGAGADPAAPDALESARFGLHGFADVTMNFSENPKPSRLAFQVGRFDLFFTSNISSDISFLTETVVEFEEGYKQVLDVERLVVRYTTSDRFHLAVGRMHSAIGWWNTYYHHGTWLQTTIDRPAALRFEDDAGLLPIHFVGAEVSGGLRRGAWTLNYVGALGNGRGSNPAVVQGTADENADKAAALRLSIVRARDGEFELGGSLYRDLLPPSVSIVARGPLREWIAGAHLRWASNRWHLLGEAWEVRHRDQTVGTETTHRAGYALGSIQAGAWAPYLMADVMDIDGRDLYFETGSTRRVIAGVRWDVRAQSALKLELRRESTTGQVNHAAAIQTSFTF